MTKDELIDIMARAAAPNVFARLNSLPNHLCFKAEADHARRSISKALDALSLAGVAVVPKEPTDDMISDCADCLDIEGGEFVIGTPDGLRAAISRGDLLTNTKERNG